MDKELLSKNSNQSSDQKELSSQSSKRNQNRNRYAVITDDNRKKLIQLVLKQGKTIQEAAETCGINVSTAKGIIQVFWREGRVGKKKKREQSTNYLRSLIAAQSKDKEIHIPIIPLVNKKVDEISKVGKTPAVPTVVMPQLTTPQIKQSPMFLPTFNTSVQLPSLMNNYPQIFIQQSLPFLLAQLQNNCFVNPFQNQFNNTNWPIANHLAQLPNSNGFSPFKPKELPSLPF